VQTPATKETRKRVTLTDLVLIFLQLLLLTDPTNTLFCCLLNPTGEKEQKKKNGKKTMLVAPEKSPAFDSEESETSESCIHSGHFVTISKFTSSAIREMNKFECRSSQ
jgi:hypothetical protein